MPGRIDPNNPMLSVKIGIERKQKIIERVDADKNGITLSQYINQMIDKWFEVLSNAK